MCYFLVGVAFQIRIFIFYVYLNAIFRLQQPGDFAEPSNNNAMPTLKLGFIHIYLF